MAAQVTADPKPSSPRQPREAPGAQAPDPEPASPSRVRWEIQGAPPPDPQPSSPRLRRDEQEASADPSPPPPSHLQPPPSRLRREAPGTLPPDPHLQERQPITQHYAPTSEPLPLPPQYKPNFQPTSASMAEVPTRAPEPISMRTAPPASPRIRVYGVEREARTVVPGRPHFAPRTAAAPAYSAGGSRCSAPSSHGSSTTGSDSSSVAGGRAKWSDGRWYGPPIDDHGSSTDDLNHSSSGQTRRLEARHERPDASTAPTRRPEPRRPSCPRVHDPMPTTRPEDSDAFMSQLHTWQLDERSELGQWRVDVRGWTPERNAHVPADEYQAAPRSRSPPPRRHSNPQICEPVLAGMRGPEQPATRASAGSASGSSASSCGRSDSSASSRENGSSASTCGSSGHELLIRPLTCTTRNLAPFCVRVQ